MKVYSEETKKFYETVEECEKAEAEYKAEKEKLALEKADKDKEVSKRKKELSDIVDDAETALNVAYKDYEDVYKKAQEELQTALDVYKSKIFDATENIKKKEEERNKAIRNFNREFGTFKKIYTGEQADREFDRIVNMFDNLFRFPLF